ncbi:MAG: hypothetical protein AAGG01_15065 [Planctomycetota bacterium]
MSTGPEDNPAIEKLGKAIDRAAAVEREIMAEASGDVREQDIAAARSFVAQQLEEDQPQNSSGSEAEARAQSQQRPETPAARRAPWILLVAAAVAALAVGAWQLTGSSHSSSPDERIRLGRGAVHLHSPEGVTHAIGRFRWEGSLAPGERWTVLVERRASGGVWTPVLERKTNGDELDLADALADLGPGTVIRWRVECLPMGVVSDWSEATLVGDL